MRSSTLVSSDLQAFLSVNLRKRFRSTAESSSLSSFTFFPFERASSNHGEAVSRKKRRKGKREPSLLTRMISVFEGEEGMVNIV